jgi:uncharacterized protein
MLRRTHIARSRHAPRTAHAEAGAEIGATSGAETGAESSGSCAGGLPGDGLRGDGAPPADDRWVASPCTGVCILQSSGVCKGCGRTLGEITSWTGLNAAQRRIVIRDAALRRASSPG